jgi:hypothetical protein
MRGVIPGAALIEHDVRINAASPPEIGLAVLFPAYDEELFLLYVSLSAY